MRITKTKKEQNKEFKDHVNIKNTDNRICPICCKYGGFDGKYCKYCKTIFKKYKKKYSCKRGEG